MPRYPIVMEVKEIKTDLPPMCPVHKVGDKVAINNGTVEGKICLGVLTQQFARLYGLANGMIAANTLTYACPDRGKVVFEIRRDVNHWYKDAISPLTDAPVKPPVP